MASPRFAWGIDIGNRALKAVKLVSSAEGLVIDDFDVIEHENVLSAAGDNRESLIQSALAAFVARHPGIEKGQVGVGVTGQQSFARFIKLPPVEPKKIPEIVRFEAIQQIPFPLDEVEWSYQLFEEPESPDVEVGIFAMRKDLVNQHIKFFTDAKLNVQAVQMNPLSVYNAMYYDSRIKGTTMMIDVGAENTDLIIAEGETIWMRSISIGGNNFTEALTKAFKVNFAKAEDLKRNASTSKYGRQIMQAMRPIFADLVSEIQRSIGFYSSVHKESRISKVIATGSTFRLPGLQKYLSQNLTLDVEKLDRLGTGSGGGAMEDPKVAATLSENLLSAAGAYGLALQVMGQGKISSSLLPESIKRDKMWAEKTKWFVGTAALFMVAAAIPYGRQSLENSQFNSTESQNHFNDIMTVKSKAEKNDADWTTIEGSGTAEKQRMVNAHAIADDKDLWALINTLIINNLPQNAKDAAPELASDKSDVIQKIKRGDRKQIFILGQAERYYPDLSAALGGGVGLTADSQMVSVIPFEQGSSGGGAPVFGGGGAPVYSPPATGTPGAPVTPIKPERGFVITLRLRTPNSTGIDLINSFNRALSATVPTTQMPFLIKGARIDRPIQIRNDNELRLKLITEYRNKEAEKLRAANDVTPPSDPGNPGGAPAGGPGWTPPSGNGGMPGWGQPGAGGGGGARNFNPGGGFAQPGMRGPEPGMATPTEKDPDEAFQDPLTHEDIRDDSECDVVFAIVIDAPVSAPVATPPGTPATPAAPKTVADAAAVLPKDPRDVR